ERGNRLRDLEKSLRLEVIVHIEMQAHFRTGAGPERGQQIVDCAQCPAVNVQLRIAWRTAESRAEADQFFPVERQDVGFQRLEATPLHLRTQRRDVIVGSERWRP